MLRIEDAFSLSEESVTDACRVRPLWPSATIRHFKHPPINNHNVHWVRTATRAAPCNKSEMTDNPYPFRTFGAKPVKDNFLSFSVMLLMTSRVLMASKQRSYCIKTLFSRIRSCVLMGAKPCFHGAEAILF